MDECAKLVSGLHTKCAHVICVRFSHLAPHPVRWAPNACRSQGPASRHSPLCDALARSSVLCCARLRALTRLDSAQDARRDQCLAARRSSSLTRSVARITWHRRGASRSPRFVPSARASSSARLARCVCRMAKAQHTCAYFKQFLKPRQV